MNCSAYLSHFGDCYRQALLLGKLPGKHLFRCNPEYHKEFGELFQGMEIELGESIQGLPDDTWPANGRFNGVGVVYTSQTDIMEFVMRYLNAQCDESGIPKQFLSRTDLLADWPSLMSSSETPECEILFIAAAPRSGQVPGYDQGSMNTLCDELSERHKVIEISDRTKKITMAEIGRISGKSRLIVSVATGPMWPTWNVWSTTAQRIIMLEPMRIDFGIPCDHASNVTQIRVILEKTGWL